MAPFYKQFFFFRTAPTVALRSLTSIFFTLILFIAMPVHAANAIFTVENVTVDVTAKDSYEARNQAFEKAQVKAYQKLMNRILSDDEVSSIQLPGTPVISSMIQDYEVTREKLSTVRYVGTYTFRFKENAVKRFVGGQGATFTDVGSQPVLALPFWQDKNSGALLWSPNNYWMTAWNRATDLSGLVPIVVPLGDLQDIQDIGDGEALHYETYKLQKMLARYQAKEAVILIAEPDYELSQVKTDVDTAAGRLYVQIYRTDLSNPELTQEITITPNPAETRAVFFDRAVREVKKALQKDWKQKTIVRSTRLNKLSVRVHILSLQQWAETQNALKSVQGIENVALISLTPKYAMVDLMYKGDVSRLQLALKQANMTLQTAQAKPKEPEQQQPSNYLDKYSINSFLSGSYDTEEDVSYDLYLNKYRPPESTPQEVQPQSGFSYQPLREDLHTTQYPGRYNPKTGDQKDSFEANF